MCHAPFVSNAGILLPALFAVSYSMSYAVAAPVYGYVYSEQVYAQPNYNNTYLSPAAQVPVQATTFSGGDSQAGVSDEGFNYASVRNWLTSDGQNVGLHVTSETNAPHPVGGTYGFVYSNSDLMYFDTYHFSGAPGQTGRIQINYTLEGTTYSPANDIGVVQAYLGIYSNITDKACPDYGYDVLPPLPYVAGACYLYDGLIQAIGPGTFQKTDSLIYTVEAGSNAIFGINLGERNAYQMGTSTLDFRNTGFMQFTSLDGLGITSGSGLTYRDAPATSTDIAEPPAYALWFAALLAFRILPRRKFP
ncbi:MAG: hypothetical protein V4724_30990 [Pseudomonadota bacterium]